MAPENEHKETGKHWITMLPGAHAKVWSWGDSNP